MPSASFALQAAIFAALRRDDREHLVPRTILDALDVAYWSTVSSSASDHPTLVTVPLTIEAGARHGARALALPLVFMGAATAARRLTGRSTSPAFLLWPTAGVLAGIATARNARGQDRVTIAEQAVVAEARASSAYVAGQNAVAMGADSVVDLLTRTEPLLRALEERLGPGPAQRDPAGLAGPTGTARALSEWKAELATATAGKAAYLGTLLARWGRTRSAHDLSRDLVLDLSPGAGTTLVSATQAEWLTRRLDELALEGTQNVAVPDGVEPGAPFVLGIGHHLLDVPGDPEPPVRGFEQAPVLLAFGALWSVVAARHENEDAGWAVVPGVAGSLLLAGWAQLRVRARRPAVDPALLTALVATSAVHGTCVALHQRRFHDERGLPLFPQLGGPITALALLVSQRTARSLDRRLALAGATITAATLPGFAAARRRHPLRLGAVLVASLNLLAWWMCMWGSDDDLERHRAGLVETCRAAAAALEAAARSDGHDRVRGLVATALADSRARHDRLTAAIATASDVDPRTHVLVAEVDRRLGEAARMLDELGEMGELLEGTTGG